MEPTELLFWGVMSLGVIAGFILAYPSNVWMVARQLKHGLMNPRKPEWKAIAVPAEQLQVQLATHAHEGRVTAITMAMTMTMVMADRQSKAITT
jgi:Domain of unknown function (DUF4396)